MDEAQESVKDEQDQKIDEGENIDKAFVQMALLYKSRCVQPPLGSNVTIREIKKDN